MQDKLLNLVEIFRTLEHFGTVFASRCTITSITAVKGEVEWGLVNLSNMHPQGLESYVCFNCLKKINTDTAQKFLLMDIIHPEGLILTTVQKKMHRYLLVGFLKFPSRLNLLHAQAWEKKLRKLHLVIARPNQKTVTWKQIIEFIRSWGEEEELAVEVKKMIEAKPKKFKLRPSRNYSHIFKRRSSSSSS